MTIRDYFEAGYTARDGEPRRPFPIVRFALALATGVIAGLAGAVRDQMRRPRSR